MAAILMLSMPEDTQSWRLAKNLYRGSTTWMGFTRSPSHDGVQIGLQAWCQDTFSKVASNLSFT